jgi:hypothetical protein
MQKKVIISGLLGGVVLFAWTFVVNGILGFRSSIDMKQIPNERQVYEILKESIVEPGRYICNPAMSSSGSFPGEEPVFGIHFSGMGHGSAGKLMVWQLAVFLVAPTIGAWMLSVTSGWILASYPRKVLFFAAIGLLFAVYGALTDFRIDSYPPGDALMLAGRDVISWTLVGLVVAWRIEPEPGTLTHSQTVQV